MAKLKKENSINLALGLPEDYKIGFDDAMKIIELFKEATFGSTKKISPISFVYYFDKFGDFMKPKKHYEVVIKDMFNNLPKDTQFELLTYFNTE